MAIFIKLRFNLVIKILSFLEGGTGVTFFSKKVTPAKNSIQKSVQETFDYGVFGFLFAETERHQFYELISRYLADRGFVNE